MLWRFWGKISAVNRRRLAFYAGLLLLLVLLGFALTWWALAACAPPPLPGDELWTIRRTVTAALALMFRFGSAACFTQVPTAEAALWLGSRTFGVLLVGLALIVLWETAGRTARLGWYRRRGGHAVLAGTADDLAGLVRRVSGGVLYLAPDRLAALDLARARPFAEVTAADTHALPRQLARLGASAARLVAATTRHDLVNIAIAEAVLDRPASGELLLRLEQGSVRALSSHRLRQRAEELGRALSVVSLTALQTRRGMVAAMSGRYSLDGDPRPHIVLCGTGPALQAAALEIVRQGFGLDEGRPLISILRTGQADFSAGVLERLQSSEAAEIQVATALAATSSGLDKALTDIVLEAPPPLAVHCAGDTPEEAEAIALRVEDVLVALRQPVPPIVCYTNANRSMGSTGMIRPAIAPDLAEARDLAQLMDRRAEAVHDLFLAAQQAARGASFGTAPAETGWARLPEPFRDDNRNVADQMDFKLASIFMLAEPGQGDGAALAPAEAERLARIAHARWWASKALSGWRYGATRDDRAQLHPDMQPYDRLAEPVKQKDRDEVASLPAMARLAGEMLKRERRVAVPLLADAAALESLVLDLRATPKTVAPVAVLPLDRPAMVAIAASLLAEGIRVEAVLGRPADYALPGLADVLRRAWRIHVAAGDAHSAVAARAPAHADERGAIDA
jgi:hypothetical protein